MTTGWKEILDQVAGPGDLATVLIAGSAGYTIDAGLNVVGFMEPGVVGVIAASGTLGVKKWIEVYGERRRHSAKATGETTRKALTEQAARAKRLIELFEKEGCADLVENSGKRSRFYMRTRESRKLQPQRSMKSFPCTGTAGIYAKQPAPERSRLNRFANRYCPRNCG